MASVYKICYLVNNKPVKLFVFIGSRIIEEKEVDINTIYKTDPSNKIFSDIFTDEEKKIKEIIFVSMEIHLDDTIESIKKKYIVASKKESPTYSGLYIFAKTNVKLTPEKVYRTLTQNDDIELTQERLEQFLINIDDIDVENISNKKDDVFNYDDIISLGLQTKDDWTMSVPIGHKFLAIEGTYPFSANPYNIIEFDDFLIQHSIEILTTTNQNLLMEMPIINSNTIYACHIEDVLTYMTASGLSHENAIDIYYPYLKEHGVTSLADFESKKEELSEETKKLISDETWNQNIENIDMFYDISNSYKGDDMFTEVGIKQARIILNPESLYNLPLDIVFKLINATKIAPLIKYNPDKRQEKIYRLHVDKTSVNGKKIPSLSKSIIFRLVNVLAKNKEVAVYIEHLGEYIILSFFDDCRIEAYVDLKVPKSVDELTQFVKNACNPTIILVSEYLQQSGYSMKTFNDIRDTDINVDDLVYILKTTLTKQPNIKSILKCVSSIFNVIDDDISKIASLRFKKVANYNEMSGIEAFIVESLNTGAGNVEIIKGLIDNFKIKNDDEAKKILVDFISAQQVVQQAFRNRRFKIKNNPGFLTTMELKKFESTLITTITGINNIKYLDTVSHYIRSLMIITQAPTSTNVPLSRISKFCKGDKLSNEIRKEDVIAKVEEPNQVQSLVFESRLEDQDIDMKKSMLSMLLGDDSDYDEEEDQDDSDDDQGGGIDDQVEEDQDDSDDDQGGGIDDSDDEDDVLRNITGLSLSNPNPFSHRLNIRDPKLFITTGETGFSSYSRSCASDLRRQPVILTQKEKDRIDREHPGSYENSISYKSSTDSPTYHYICPRYWSLKEGVSLTQEDVDSGKYGSIIPAKSKEVPPGAGVYEFDGTYHRNDKKEYVGTQPGFMKPDKHPDGLCVPCCFKNWNAPSQIKLREKCKVDASEPEETDLSEEKKKKKTKKKTLKIGIDKFEEYVKGPEKFPLEPGRIGFLPINIQLFLQTDNTQCQISSKNTNIKKDTPCLVRQGIEKSKYQSFIAAIACIYTDFLPSGEIIPSIQQMKQIILKSMDIDRFITLQNGNLVSIFDDGKDVSLAPYSSSKIYKELNTSDPNKLAMIKKYARSYENFCRYIENPDIQIGYEYLWDLICFNNPKLFNKGLNLVIIESKDDDITRNVGVICPSNHYSKIFFDPNKQTAILIKRDDIYEPIIIYEDKDIKYKMIRTFSLKSPHLMPSLKEFLMIIKNSLNEKCIPLPSRPKKYKFKTNINLEKMIYYLKLKKYTVKSQLINYNGKIIGLEVDKDGIYGMIPVFPSALSQENIDYKLIDEFAGVSYENTIELLNYIKKDLKEKVLCAPLFKVIDDSLIVGIITETNQFVPINPPVIDTYGDDLDIIKDTDYKNINDMKMSEQDTDNERLLYMKKIKAETGFFNTFRNIVRMMLGQYKHGLLRKVIEETVSTEDLTYLSKIKIVDKKIRELLFNVVKFVKFNKAIINDIDTITNCTSLSSEKCLSKPYCLTEADSCLLLIPKKNLITDIDNDVMYYGRIADEIVRYSRIRTFIFEPNMFLSFSELKYNLRDDEIILLQTLLKQDYFDDLVPRTETKYAKHTTYDTAVPIDGQEYTNIVKVDNRDRDSNSLCLMKPSVKLTGKWENVFPPGSQALEFTNSNIVCSFNIITTILQAHDKEWKDISFNDIRSILVDEYDLLYKDYKRNILSIMRAQGKSLMATKLAKNEINIETLIMNESYYLTPLDIWIISRRFKIPIVLITSTKFLENDKNIIVCNSTGKSLFFIKVSGVKKEKAPIYNIIFNELITKFEISELGKEVSKEIKNQQSISDDLLISFLETYNPSKKSLVVVDKLNITKQDVARDENFFTKLPKQEIYKRPAGEKSKLDLKKEKRLEEKKQEKIKLKEREAQELIKMAEEDEIFKQLHK